MRGNSFGLRKGILVRKVFPLFWLLCLVAGAAFFTACDTGNKVPGLLTATWKNVAGDYVTIITITENTVVYQGSYEADIVNDPDFTALNGVLIIKFTKYADWGSEPNANHDNVGKYGALYWKDLDGSSVSLADAYTGYTHTMFDDLTDAEVAFTNDKVGDYIDWAITSPYSNTN
jgi:hypothetical protein